MPNNPVECRVCRELKACAADRLCHKCRSRSPEFSPRYKYVWASEQEDLLRGIYREARNKPELSRGISDMVRRTGFPRYIVTTKAQSLGITVDTRRPWTPAELEKLADLVGTTSVKAIARRLKRSSESVNSQIRYAKLAGHYKGSHPTEGYSQGEFAAVLGVPQEKVRRWVAAGLLRLGAKRISPDRISEAEATRFVSACPDLYDLRRVDQAWFKGIVFPGFVSMRQVQSAAVESEMAEAAC